MKKAKAQRRAKLPLDDPRWWNWGRAIAHVRQLRLNHAIADQELATAINGRHVPCKMEWLDPRADPPKRGVILLEDSFFAAYRIEPGWGKLLAVALRPDVRLPRDHVLYAWGPEIERIWPPAAPPSEQRAGEGACRRSRTQEMIRGIAADEWPDGYERVETDEIRKRVGEVLKGNGLPVPSRATFQRALGRRKG